MNRMAERLTTNGIAKSPWLRAALMLALATAIAVPMRGQGAGEKTYKAKCAACHGADGKPTATGEKLGARDFGSAEVKKETDAQLSEIIAKGKNKMPAYKTLKEDEIKELVAYIRELGNKK